MTSSARDLRYGRRGGGWAEGPPRALPDGWTPPAARDHRAQFHPDNIARDRAHANTPSCPANDRNQPEPCTCQPDPDDLAAVWAGRARMAAARKAAGKPLDDIDRQALKET